MVLAVLELSFFFLLYVIVNLRTRYLIIEDLSFRISKICNAGVDPSL